MPPGQHTVDDFPVLSAGPSPRTPTSEWSFAIDGAVDSAAGWTWDQLRALPSETFTVDVHCVTKWSKLGTTWTGVSVDTLLEGIDGGPLLLVAGGSGLAPLMAMLRHRANRGSDADARLLVSAQGWEDVLYRAELGRLDGGVRVSYTLTRRRPEGWQGWARRVDAGMLAEVGPEPSAAPRVYVCGPTAFVERVADLLVGLGTRPAASTPSASGRRDERGARPGRGRGGPRAGPLARRERRRGAAGRGVRRRRHRPPARLRFLWHRGGLGQHRAYLAAGVVLRCPACGDVAARIVSLPDRLVVELRGSWSVELPR